MKKPTYKNKHFHTHYIFARRLLKKNNVSFNIYISNIQWYE